MPRLTSDRATRDAHRDLAIEIPAHDNSPESEDRIQVGEPEARSAQSMETAGVGVHSIVTKIALGASLWFLAVVWFAFAAKDGGTNLYLAIVMLFFVFFFGLFLLTASYTVKDPRWPVRETNLREFLKSKVEIGGETMRGRDVLIETALVPVSLAFAATLIGLAWMIFG
jgi:hypothetical protein